AVWRVMLAAEVALAFTLSGGALLAVQTLVRLARVNPGFELQGIYGIRMFLPRQDAAAAKLRDADTVLADLRVSQWMSRAAFSDTGLFDPVNGIAVRPPGDLRPLNFTAPVAEVVNVGSGYFSLLGIPLQGRDFALADFAHTPSSDRAASGPAIV